MTTAAPKRDQKTGLWSFVVDIGIDPKTGKRRQARRRGFKTRREAQEAMSRLRVKVADRTYVPATNIAVADYFDQWLETQRSQVRPSTWDSYARNVRLHVVPYLGRMRLRDLDPHVLTMHYATLHESGRTEGNPRRERTGPGLSARSVRYISTIVSKAMLDAVSERVISVSPATGAKVPKTESQPGEMRVWSATDVDRFLEATKSEFFHPVFVMAATTGMRRGEILGLRWKDLDFDRRRAAVIQTVISINRTILIGQPKTKRGRRTVPLVPEALQVLRAHRRAQSAHKLAVEGYRDQGLVFATEEGDPLQPDAVSEVFRRRVHVHRLPRIAFHDLRHTFATLALAAGVPAKVVAEILGHSSTSVTTDIYSHATPSMQEEASDRVASMIFGRELTGSTRVL